MNRASRAVWLAAITGFVLRLAFGLGYWIGKPLTHDEHEYLALARNLNAGRGFTYDPPTAGEAEPEHFGRAPVYPLFVAAVLRVAGDTGRHEHSPASVKVAQAFVGASAIFLLAALARLAAGARAAAIAAWIAALYPPLVFIGAYVLSEALFVALALASVLTSEEAMRRRSTRSFMTAGILAGLAALARPVMLVFIALMTMHLLRRYTRAAAVVFAIGSMAAIGPWILRNVRTYDRVVLIASEGGITFWTGNHPHAIGEGDMAGNPAIKLANRELRRRYPGFTPEQLERVYYREAFAAIRERPVRWIGLLARKMFYFWVPVGPSYSLHSWRYRLATTVPYLVLFPFAALGALGLAPRQRPVALFVFALSSVIAAIVFFPQERFRIAMLDPALILCGAAWIEGATLSTRREA